MQAARLPLQRKVRDRGSRLVRQKTAEREREGSAAKSTQRMSACRVAPCRGTTAPAYGTKMRRPRSSQCTERCQKISRRRAPKLSIVQKQCRARFCSTAPARIVALPVWNETGTLTASNRLLSRSPRKRNDSRSQSRNRSRSQPMRSERWLSRQP